ncbi:beta-galactosidase, partial [Bacillus sp. 7586-K]
ALGKLDELAGVETLYSYPIDGTGSVGEFKGVKAPLSLWSSLFHPIDAKVMGTLTEGISIGMAFITERNIGNGKIVMLGSFPTGDEGELLLKTIINHYANEQGVTVKAQVTEGTIIVPRQGNGYLLWVIVNMDGKGGKVQLPYNGTNVLTGKTVEKGEHFINGYDYQIVKFGQD